MTARLTTIIIEVRIGGPATETEIAELMDKIKGWQTNVISARKIAAQTE